MIKWWGDFRIEEIIVESREFMSFLLAWYFKVYWLICLVCGFNGGNILFNFFVF